MNKRKTAAALAGLLLLTSLAFTGCQKKSAQLDVVPPAASAMPAPTPMQEYLHGLDVPELPVVRETTLESKSSVSASEILTSVPEWDGETPWTAVNGNTPFFTDTELKTESFEDYSELDSLGRCQKASACIGQDIMPAEERGEIGDIKPTGWQSVEMKSVDGGWLYNRCHLIGFQLTGENANERNLITGTRYMNVTGMLPFENMVSDYVKETGNHVMYRVTPIFDGTDLLAKGVLMEAKSVEDAGEGVLFNVFVYNAQPGVGLNYATGETLEALPAGSETPAASEAPAESSQPGSEPSPESSAPASEAPEPSKAPSQSAAPAPSKEPAPAPTKAVPSEDPEDVLQLFILNTDTMRFHKYGCHAADKMDNAHRAEVESTAGEIMQQGYVPCGICEASN